MDNGGFILWNVMNLIVKALLSRFGVNSLECVIGHSGIHIIYTAAICTWKRNMNFLYLICHEYF